MERAAVAEFASNYTSAIGRVLNHRCYKPVHKTIDLARFLHSFRQICVHQTALNLAQLSKKFLGVIRPTRKLQEVDRLIQYLINSWVGMQQALLRMPLTNGVDVSTPVFGLEGR